MTPTKQDITIYQGTDFATPFDLPDSLGSLTDAVAALQIRKEYGDVEPSATLTTWGGSLLLDADARTLTPVIDEDLSASLLRGTYLYDVKIRNSEGFSFIVFNGLVDVVDVLNLPSIQTNITIYQGTDYNQPLDIPANIGSLIGAAATMQIRKSAGDSTAVATLSTQNGSLLLDADARTLTPVIDEELSESLPAGDCFYDALIQTAGGFTSVVHEGLAIIEPIVTIIPMPSPVPEFAGQFDFSNAGNSAYVAII